MEGFASSYFIKHIQSNFKTLNQVMEANTIKKIPKVMAMKTVPKEVETMLILTLISRLMSKALRLPIMVVVIMAVVVIMVVEVMVATVM